MIILLNGPLGVGKSTLAEVLMESIDGCVMLDGDSIVAVNPPPADEPRYLNATLTLLVAHHQRAGYRHFVIDHLWTSPHALDALRAQLAAVAPGQPIHAFLLTLSLEDNLRRIRARQAARAIDEREFEWQTVMAERALLEGRSDVGEPLEVTAAPEVVAAVIRARLGL
ncbi:MAG: Gar/GrdA family gentamicin resistance ATP-binding protein [Gemmatimonadaceae bacterium]